MRTDSCFDPATYQRMLAGELPAAEMETVCEHLEKCQRCLQVVRTFPEDALAASLRSNSRESANAVGSTFVRDLAQKILQQGGRTLPDFIMFSCGGCGNKLKVKDELSGKKVKCPKCNQVVQVPAAASSAAAGGNARPGGGSLEEKTRAPQDAASNLDAPTLQPANIGTVAPVSEFDTNVGPPGPAEDRSLTDFLAPPLEPDEIGRLGGYRVLKVLGAGGMGVVFKAEDPGLQRLVAVKAMLPAIAASVSAKQRFLREARAAAAIKHNHIVTIFQVGEDRGVPFLAMEFLEGEPLDDLLKRETILPLDQVVRIGREMAEGMAAAHKRGLIHRDIKPANTWLETKDEGGGMKDEKKNPKSSSDSSFIPHPSSFQVKILDFGLARSTDDQAHLTQSGAIIGTPQYMAPEQGRGEKLDARCDLWSLGVVLYRMSTGELPFKGADTVSTLMAVAMNNPPPPAKVNRAIPAGLSKLIMKLLEKDPAKRPASAQEVAEALRALEQEQQEEKGRRGEREKGRTSHSPSPLLPSSHSPRRRTWIAVASALVAAIALGIVVFWPTPDGVIRIESDDPDVEVVFDKDGPTIKGADKEPIRLSPARHGVLIQRGDFKFTADNFEMKKGDKITLKIEFLKGKMQFLRNGEKIGEKNFPPPDGSLLAKNDPAKKSETPPDLPTKKEDPPKEKTPPPLGPLTVSVFQTFQGHTDYVRCVALSGDGKRVLTGSRDKTAILWKAAGGKQLQTFKGHTAGVESTALSGDGKRVLTGSYDKIAILWDAVSGQKIQTFQGHIGPIDGVALRGDGQRVLTGSRDKTAILWDVVSGKKIQTFQGHTGIVWSVDLSGDGKHVLTGSQDTTAILWDAVSGQKIRTFKGHTDSVGGVALSGDGKHVLTGSVDKTAILWDAASGQKIHTFQGHTAEVRSVALSGDGKHVLTGSGDKTAILWDAASGQRLQTVQVDNGIVWSVALSGDGKYVLTGSEDKTAILWEVKATPPPPFVPLNLAEKEAKKLQEDWAAKLKLPVEATNKIGMKLMLIPPAGAALPEAYYLGKYEVTQAEWQQVMGYNPSHFGPLNSKVADTSKFPVEMVSWFACVEYCNKLSEREGLKPYYDLTVAKRDGTVGKQIEQAEVKILGGSGYHLPTEAEWEHGCRAGTKTRYHFGDKDADLPDYAWFGGNSQNRTHGVGEKKPNAFGLHDMHGNLWEWCEELSDPKVGPYRVIRGGCWNEGDGSCRAASRSSYVPAYRQVKVGFRVARVPSGEAKTEPGAVTVSMLQKFQGHPAVYSVALSRDGTLALTNGGDDKTAILWDAASGNKLQTFAHGIAYSGATLSGDGKYVLVGDANGSPATLWDAASGKKIQTFSVSSTSVALSADGNLALTGAVTGTANLMANLWDAATGKKLKSFQGHTKNLTSVALSGDGKYVVTGSDDKTAILWDAAGGQKIHTFEGHTDRLMSVALSADGKYVLTGSSDKTAILWDAASGTKLQTFHGHSADVTSVALSGDGKLALTGSRDNTAILWDAASGRKIHTFQGHAYYVLSVALSGDGKRALIGSTGPAILWEIKASPATANMFKNSLGMEFALVPKGKSWLGGGNGKEGTTEVNIPQDFYLGVYEVTQEEWLKVMGKNPSQFSRGGASRGWVSNIADDELKRFPVENVNWHEAKFFVKLLNEMVSKDALEAGYSYRLPTEQQWEYACRGGPMTGKADSAFDFCFENPALTMAKDRANFLESGWKRPRKVGSYAPNRLGLYDMHGNVREWCEDQTDPKKGWLRACRGGGWDSEPASCGAAYRAEGTPQDTHWNALGLRLARVPSLSK